jgi:hypothetical protein
MVSKMTESVSQHHMPGYLIQQLAAHHKASRHHQVVFSCTLQCLACLFDALLHCSEQLLPRCECLRLELVGRGVVQIQFIPVDHQDYPSWQSRHERCQATHFHGLGMWLAVVVALGYCFHGLARNYRFPLQLRKK